MDRHETVGAHPCVCPQNVYENTILNIQSKGQTHGSAPTLHKYNRKSLRLPHYDYSRAGYYFITIVAQNREHLFGEIVDGNMVLNMAGLMVEEWYIKLEEKFPNVKNHEMVIMPNHIHFIIEIQSYDSIANEPMIKGRHTGLPLRQNNMLKPVGADPCVRPQNNVYIGDIIQWFKTMTTNQYIKMVKNNTLPPFNKRIWQRNYYEHVIRDENDYVRIAEYIVNNPLSWELDTLNEP